MRIIIESDDGQRTVVEPTGVSMPTTTARAPAPGAAVAGAIDAGPAPTIGAPSPVSAVITVSAETGVTYTPGESAGAAPGHLFGGGNG